LDIDEGRKIMLEVLG